MISSLLAFPLAIVLSTVSVIIADAEAPFPVFDETKCIEENGVRCFVAYTSPVNTKRKIVEYAGNSGDGQLMFRIFNPKKMILDCWVGGTSVVLKHGENNLFSCNETNGEMKSAKTETSTFVTGEYSDGKLYCRILLESKSNREIFPVTPSGDVKLIFGVQADQPEEYTISRNSLTDNLKVGSCSVDWNGKLAVEKGFRVLPLPYDNIFASSIACPEGTLVSYKEDGTGRKKPLVQYHEAMDMTCKKDENDGNNYKWFMNDVNGSPLTPVSPSEIKYAGCKYQECKMCKEITTFPCKAADCTPPTKMKAKDGCDYFQCDNSYIGLNDDAKPQQGNITCTAIGPNDEPRWALGSVGVEKAECPKEVPCRPSRLECVIKEGVQDVKDVNCTSLSFTKEDASCKKPAKMIVGGKEIKKLECDRKTGKYMMIDAVLPDNATIKCEDPPLATKGPQASTSNIGLIAGGGAAVVIVIIAVVVIVWCCMKRRKKGRSTTSHQPATTATNTTKSKETTTRSKETTRSREKLNKSSTPATTKTSTAPTPLAVTGLGNDESNVEPQLTPFFVSPLKEAPTQEHKEKSESSAPNRPTPGKPAPLPLPFNPNVLPEDQKKCELMPSVKQARDNLSDRFKDKGGVSEEDDVHQPPDSAPKKKAKRRPKKSKTRTTSVKRTQESSTKRTQNTQHTRSANRAVREEDDEEEAAKPKADRPPKPKKAKKGAKPPKKTQYSALNELPDDDESSKDENEKKRLAQPFQTPSREKVDNDYLALDKCLLASGVAPEQVDNLAKKAELAKSTTNDDDKNLVTQQSTEEDKKEKK